MKKKIILPFLAIIALSSCNVNIEKSLMNTTPILLTDDVNQDLAYLRNIASSYNKDESLSFYNYFTNALNLPIYNDNTILYNNKVYKIEGQDISFKEDYLKLNYSNEEDDILALNTKIIKYQILYILKILIRHMKL